MKILLVITSFILVELVPMIFLLSEGNSTSVSTTRKVIHSSNKCEVSSYNVNNSKYSDGKIYSIKIFKNKMNFEVTKNPSNFDFSINSNFFASKPLGEVIIDSKIVNRRVYGGGFFISNGKNFDFTINSRPKNINYSSQTHLVGIKNGKLNNSIMYQRWSKVSAYRILLGKDRYGNFLALHSDRYSPISIKEICEIGIKEGMIVGLVFDGGTSVDVKINDGLYSHRFSVVPNFTRAFDKDLQPPVYIAGNF